MHSYSFMNIWVIFYLGWDFSSLLVSLTAPPGRRTDLPDWWTWVEEVRVGVWALPFFPLVKRKEAGSASPAEALLGTMPGSVCLTQRWSIHVPASCSMLGPRVQDKHQRELLCGFCLLQPDPHVCIPVGGSDLFSLLKPLSCHRHRQCFVASVRWSSSKDRLKLLGILTMTSCVPGLVCSLAELSPQLKLLGILTMTSRVPGLVCSLAELSPQALLIPPVTK